MKAAGCDAPPDKCIISSHSLRCGGASAFICACPQLLDKLKWWMRWALTSDTTVDHYIQFTWTLAAHPEARYFFGDFAAS